MSKWRNMLKAVRRGVPPEQERFEKQHPHLARPTQEDLSKLEYTPINIPKIDHAEELQKMRDHIAANPDGEGGPSGFDDHYHFLNTGKPSSVKPTPEQLTVETIRAKVGELNATIAKAVEFGIKVEIDSMSRYHIANGETTYLTATISKVL